VVERLLVGRADVNAAAATNGSRTASQAAAEDGRLDVVERLLVAGADINAAGGKYGRTALQAAAGGGNLDVMEMLLTAEADINTAASYTWRSIGNLR
jgi:ankyrin repeat protein